MIEAVDRFPPSIFQIGLLHFVFARNIVMRQEIHYYKFGLTKVAGTVAEVLNIIISDI